MSDLIGLFANRWALSALCVVVLGALIMGCGSGDSRREITEVRESSGAPIPPALSPSERLGMQSPHGESPHGGAMPGMAGPGSGSPGGSGWAYEAPESWHRGPERPMRIVTFSADSEGLSECYVAVLSGAAGGVEANINRWREQMRQPPLTPEEIAALPVISMLGREAAYVEITGEYAAMAGMGGTAEAVPAQMMLGAVCSLDDSTVFVKMTGPETMMRNEIEHFKAFCSSLKKESK